MLLALATYFVSFTVSPSAARDRPGTPNNVVAGQCWRPNSSGKPFACLFFNNTASEPVVFEPEATANGQPYKGSYSQCENINLLDGHVCAQQFVAAGGWVSSYDGGKHELAVNVRDLEFDTQYCFRLRARRLSDGVVSEQWSNWSCEHTPPAPPAPAKPAYTIDFFAAGSGIGVYDLGSYKALRPGDPAADVIMVRTPYTDNAATEVSASLNLLRWGKTQEATHDGAYYYQTQANTDYVPVYICAKNYSGQTCNAVLISTRQNKVVVDEECRAHTNCDILTRKPAYSDKLPLGSEAAAAPRLPEESDTPLVASASDYAGVWKVRTAQNAEYEMTLHVNGDAITGEFTDPANGTYNGTLTGKFSNGHVSLTWVQPRNIAPGSTQPAQGTGTLRAHTDNTLGGGITYRAPDATQPTLYRWAGTRSFNSGVDAPRGRLSDYAGIWKVRTVQNAEYLMTLRVSGDTVTGEFSNTQNHAYDGTLTGTFSSGRLSISWIQPRNFTPGSNVPAQGTGTINVHPDNTFDGGIIYPAPGATQPTLYRWFGVRQ
jgi:hypothetical protein